VKSVFHDGKAILGVAATSGHVFIARVETPEIEMYSAMSWSLQRRFALPDLKTPTDIVVHEELNRLYVCDWSNTCVHFTDISDTKSQSKVNDLNLNHTDDRHPSLESPTTNGWSHDRVDGQIKNEQNTEFRTKWSVDDSPWSMSITQQGNSLLVICDQACSI
jgi:hypothetical protein